MTEKIIKDLSSEFTDNKVYLCENKLYGKFIKKVYVNKDKYTKELIGYEEIDEAYRPQLFEYNQNELSIYTAFHPLERKISDCEIVDLLYAFHMSTAKRGPVYFPAENKAYQNWIAYIECVSKAWINRLDQYYVNIIDVVQGLIQDIHTTNQYDGFISYIHRDVRSSNIGERNGKLILFDFELGIWGNPLWDIARYGYENLENTTLHKMFIEKYNIEEGLYKSYLKLYSISFLNYLLKVKSSNSIEIEKCTIFLSLIEK